MMRIGAAVLFLAFLAGANTAFATRTSTSLDRLTWIAGCWEGEARGAKFQEQWMRPEGDMMMGMSRTLKGGRTVAFEFLQLRQDGGEIFYVARPQGKEPTPFKLVREAEHEAVFENLEHDFPQRIIYRLGADGSLFARIEGMRDGKTQGIDYPMKRAKCD